MITQVAYITQLTVFSVLLVFHMAVIFKLIPYHLIWGGRLKNDRQMLKYEIVSFVVIAILWIFTVSDAGFLEVFETNNFRPYIYWGLALLFLFNTLGNVKSESKLEKTLFTLLTILLFASYAVLIIFN